MESLRLLLMLTLTWQPNAWCFYQKGSFLVGNLLAPRDYRRSDAVQSLWYSQLLDHSNPNDERRWQQQYFVNDEYYRGGPAFLLLGREEPASHVWMTEGVWVEYADKFGAMLFQLEHRYYGYSRPTEDVSLENLKYLTSEQALDDAAEFIVAMRNKFKLPTPTKWIVFGGSYSGSLAAWMRSKHPHLVHGAVSSSGPLMAQVDFQDYFRVVAESLGTHSDACVTSFQDAFDQIKLLTQNTIGQRKLDRDLHLCYLLENHVENQNHVSSLFESLADVIGGVVQYNKVQGITPNIDDICDIMVNESIGTAEERFGVVTTRIIGESCMKYNYDDRVASVSNSTWSSQGSKNSRQWTYQMCTEFGFFQTSTNEPHVFGNQIPIEYYIQKCEDIFDVRYNESFLENAVNMTNRFYGALGIEVTNVVFIHGSIDPWHPLGITKTHNPAAPAIYINGTAHTADMYVPLDSEFPELIAAIKEKERLIGSWLSL